jgi:hypothetical protein
MNIKYLNIYWVTTQEDKPIIEEISFGGLINCVDYIEEKDLKHIFTTKKEAIDCIKGKKEE